MNLRERVKDLMDKKGLSQSQFSSLSGITQATLSRILQGEVEEVRPETLGRLAGALEVTVDYLLGRTQELRPAEMARTDEKAGVIFRGYQRLSEDGRRQLKDFVGWLVDKEKRARARG